MKAFLFYMCCVNGRFCCIICKYSLLNNFWDNYIWDKLDTRLESYFQDESTDVIGFSVTTIEKVPATPIEDKYDHVVRSDSHEKDESIDVIISTVAILELIISTIIHLDW